MGFRVNLSSSEPWIVRINLISGLINQPKRMKALVLPGSAKWKIARWSSFVVINFLISLTNFQEEIKLCEPAQGSSSISISSSLVDPVGAQTDTFLECFWAAIAISLQYTPAPPRWGGYSWVTIMIAGFVIVLSILNRICFAGKQSFLMLLD